MFSLYDHLAFRAKLFPEAVALQQLDKQLNFYELFLLVKKIAHKLRQAGIKPGQLVITSIPGGPIGWIVTLALFHEAVVTCSNHGYESVISTVDYDWIITDRHVAHFSAEKVIFIDENWLADARNLSHDIDPYQYASGDSIARIILTSGTTGTRKAAAWKTSSVMARARDQLILGGSNRQLCLLEISTGFGFAFAVNRLLSGQTCYCVQGPISSVADMMRSFSIQTLVASPNQISKITELLASNSENISSLTMVVYVGGAASPKLFRMVQNHLCHNILNLYGSTEAGILCLHKRTSESDFAVVGFPLPDVEVQVVNEANESVGHGEEGLVRLKSPHVMGEYFNNPLASSMAFRGGWFYPGDRGVFQEDGKLKLTGRDSEVINCGGLKLDPTPIDQYLGDYPGVKDAAVFGLENSMGNVDIAAAIVVASDFDMAALQQALLKAFGKTGMPTRLCSVRKIPRNQMGKIMRLQLADEIASFLAGNRSNS